MTGLACRRRPGEDWDVGTWERGIVPAPFVSIGVPVYNGERFLARALASLCAQDVDGLEIVISDSASNDGTPDIARDVAAQDPRVAYHPTPHRLAMWENFRRAFALSSGEWFHWACHDDLLEPDYVRRCLQVAADHPGTVSVVTATREFNDTGDTVRTVVERLPGSDHADPRRRMRAVLWHLCEGASTGLAFHRASALARTSRISNVPQSDRLLGAELALLGRLVTVDKVLQHRYQGDVHLQREDWSWLDFRNASRPYRPLRRQIGAHVRLLGETSWPARSRRRIAAEIPLAIGAWKVRSKLEFELRRRAAMASTTPQPA